MERMPFQRPTTHYDEKIKLIDEKICELIKKRKEISDSNPGYPPFEYIANWAEKFDLNQDLIKAVFGSIWNDKLFEPLVEPKEYQRNLAVLKSVEIDNRLFSVMSIRQYSNSSIVNFNIDWDCSRDSSEHELQHTNFELFVSEKYTCRMSDGCGSHGHFHYYFIVSPQLPDNLSGIQLIFKENKFPQSIDKPMGHEVVIQL